MYGACTYAGVDLEYYVGITGEDVDYVGSVDACGDSAV